MVKKANFGQSNGKVSVVERIKSLLGPLNAPSALGLVFILSMVQELSQAGELEELLHQPEQGELEQIVSILRDSYPEIALQLFPEQLSEFSSDPRGVADQLAQLEASGYLSESESQLLADTLKAMDAGSSWAVDGSQDIQLAQVEVGAGSVVESQAGAVSQATPTSLATSEAGVSAGVAVEALSPAFLVAAGVGLVAVSTSPAAAVAPLVVTPIVVPGVPTTVRLADGYVQGAQIYIDKNGDGIAQAGEMLVGVKTKSDGSFELPANVTGPIIAIGGFNIDTGVANTMIMRAPAGSTMVSPLTTLVQAYLQAHPTQSVASANSVIATALGLPAGVSLSSYDPIAALASDPTNASALLIQKAAAQVATIVQLASANPASGVAGADAGAAVIANLLNTINTGVVVNLTDTATITAALGTTSTVSASTVVAATTSISTAVSLDTISGAQSVALDHTASAAPTLALLASSDSGVSAADGITKVTSPTVRVSFDVTSVDGTAAIAGNTVQISSSAGLLASVKLTAADIANGYVDIAITGLAANATTALKAQLVDAGSNASALSAALSLNIDTSAPSTPVITPVATDSFGNITVTAGNVVVSGTAEAGSSVAVTWGSTNQSVTAASDGTWTSTFSSSQIPATGGISAIATDAAGNVSSVGTSIGSDSHVSGVLSADFFTVAGTSGVLGVTLAAGQSFNLSPAQFNSAQADFGKIENSTADYSVTLDIASASQSTDIASVITNGNSGGYIDALDLVSNAASITDAQASALVLEGIHFAADDTGVAVQAVGTHLTTSLSDLQKLGVDVVNVGVSTGEFVIAAGTGSVDFTHLPTVVAGAGVAVGLEIADSALTSSTAAQVLTDATALHAAGFDDFRMADGNLTVGSDIVNAVHNGGLVFSAQDQITMTVAGGVQDAVLTNVVGRIDSHLYAHADVDVIDLASNAINLTDAQASSLVTAGIHFAADDTGVAVQAVGTHLTTSLSDLQKLGVDVVNVGVSTGEFVIAAGTGSVDFTHLPTVVAGAGVAVGLEIADSALTSSTAAQVLTDATALHAAGFDDFRMADGNLTVGSDIVKAVHDGGLVFSAQDQITMTVAGGVQDAVLTNVVGRIDSHLYAHADVDVIDLASNAINLTDAQASSLVTAGIHFAADDTGVAVQAVGTHLTTSLHDLQNLGVDFVHTDHTIHSSNTVVLDMGAGAFTSAVLPVFDANDHVQMDVLDTQLGNVEALLGMTAGTIPGVDVLSVVLNDSIGSELGGLGVLNASIQNWNVSIELDAAFATNAVTLGMVLDAADGVADPLALLHGDSLVTALQAAGITDIKIDHITSFEVADTDLKPLMDAGLISAEVGANVTVDHTGLGTLDVTLAQLAGIGADHVVQTGGAALEVDAGVTFSGLSALETELTKLLTAFEDPTTGVVNKQLFADANAVDLHVAGTVATGTLSVGLAAQLTLLGIDHVLDDHGNILK